MKLNQDSLFAIIGTNLPAGRPTADFYALNSYSDLHATEDAITEVNHYSQAYKSLELLNPPVFGTHAFYTHTGTYQVRFTEIEAGTAWDLAGSTRLLERIETNGIDVERTHDAIRLLTLKYANLGTHIVVSRSPNGSYDAFIG